MIFNSFSMLEMIINTVYVKYMCYMLSNSLNAFVGKEKEAERFIPLVSAGPDLSPDRLDCVCGCNDSNIVVSPILLCIVSVSLGKRNKLLIETVRTGTAERKLYLVILCLILSPSEIEYDIKFNSVLK